MIRLVPTPFDLLVFLLYNRNEASLVVGYMVDPDYEEIVDRDIEPVSMEPVWGSFAHPGLGVLIVTSP